jgi:RNA polymerase sigma-70 factor (ECF subfamily)
VIGWATYDHAPGDAPTQMDASRRDVVSLLLERGARHHIFSAMAVGDLDTTCRAVECGTMLQQMADSVEVTALLRAWADGQPGAADRLVPVIYQQLRRRAAAYLRGERREHTLQPTALVHEAYLRLVDQQHVDWQNRAQFFGLASQMMRRILVDHARRRKMHKRSGQWMRVSLAGQALPGPAADFDVLALDELLIRLAEFDARKSRIVELRYFGGLSPDETASVLGIAPRTVEREWRAARAWLHSQLTAES